MTIKRQYSLPNCKLIVEGVGDESLTIGAVRPLLSMVVNVECHFVGHEKPLVGGQEFLTSLARATEDYAQEYLSGIHHPPTYNSKSPLVQIQALSPDVHRLTVQPPASPDQAVTAEPVQVDLQTVQLFDLVEAIDQLCADTQTVPELTLKLAPLPKRYIVSQEPIAKRVVPAAIGVSGLAVAAALLFLLPVPEVRRPEPAQSGETTEESSATPTANGSPDPLGASSPEPTASPEAAASPDATNSPDAEASPDASPDAEASPTSTPDENSEATSADVFETAPVITDRDQIAELTQELRDTLDEAWNNRPTFEEDLVYRVGVAENGDILGFQYINDVALEYRNEVPLLDLLYNPTDTPTNEAIAQFRVVFTTLGRVEVSSWYGLPSPESSPTP